LVQGGISRVKEIELPQERVASIERCNEVIEYHDLKTDRLLPTFKAGERLVVDKSAYQQRAPQRGDAIAFKPIPTAAPSDYVIQKPIGLPGEKVKIERGKVYINGKLFTTTDLGRIDPKLSQSIVVPANSYLLLDGKIISRSAIIGKVIWHFNADRQSQSN
jgi:signal peptidase I